MVNHRQNNWEELLPLCEFPCNHTVQGSTWETPFFLNFGFHPTSAPDVFLSPTSANSGGLWLEQQQSALHIARDCIQDAILKQEHYANQYRHDCRYKVLVHRDFLSTSVFRDQPCSKFKPRRFGPFEVLQNLGTTVLLKLPVACRAHPVFNTAACKIFHEDPINQSLLPPAPIIDRDGHERFIVQSVLSERHFHRRRQFLVKWMGYPEPTWERAANLLDDSGNPIISLQNFLRS